MSKAVEKLKELLNFIPEIEVKSVSTWNKVVVLVRDPMNALYVEKCVYGNMGYDEGKTEEEAYEFCCEMIHKDILLRGIGYVIEEEKKRNDWERYYTGREPEDFLEGRFIK